MLNDKDLQKLNQTDVYAVVCETLYALKNNPNYSVMSELAYLLDQKSFTNLVKYFGGTTIEIPTVDDFKKTIRVILLYQYFNIENMSWKDALIKAGYERSETRQAQKQLMQFTNVLESVKLGRDSI